MLNNFINIKNAPYIDLHGEPRDIAVIRLKDFIRIHYNLKNKYIIVIHGIGEGILKKAVHIELKSNSKVSDYNLDTFNTGSTIVELKTKGE